MIKTKTEPKNELGFSRKTFTKFLIDVKFLDKYEEITSWNVEKDFFRFNVGITPKGE